MVTERELRRLYYLAQEEHLALKRLSKHGPPLTEDERLEKRRQRAAAKAAAIRGHILANKDT